MKKILDNNLIEPTDKPQCVSNIALVKKANNTWRLCIDSLMSHIDHLIDSMVGHEIMLFIDVFVGYHQIAKEDHNTTSFLTEKNVY